MKPFRLFSYPAESGFEIRLFRLESDVVPSRADGCHRSCTRAYAVVKYRVAFIRVGLYQIFQQGYRLLRGVVETAFTVAMTDVGYLLSAILMGVILIWP